MSDTGLSTRKPAGAPPDEHERAAIERLLTRLVEIPRAARAFKVSEREATGKMGISPVVLARLEALSLADPRNGERHFDISDLINVQYQLGRGVLSAGLMWLWPKMLQALPEPGPVVFEIGFWAACSDPGHPGTCDFRIVLPDGRAFQAPAPAGQGDVLASLRLELPTRWPELPQAAKDIIDELRDVRFLLLPHKIRWGARAFVSRTRMADCVTFAHLFTEYGVQRGLRMRVSSGLLIAPPIAVPHYWAEIELGGLWVPTDPLLINAALSIGRLSRESWPAHRSPGATFLPLGERSELIGTHRGDPVNVICRSRVVSLRQVPSLAATTAAAARY